MALPPPVNRRKGGGGGHEYMVRSYGCTPVQCYRVTELQWYRVTVVQGYSGTGLQWYSGTVLQGYMNICEYLLSRLLSPTLYADVEENTGIVYTQQFILIDKGSHPKKKAD